MIHKRYRLKIAEHDLKELQQLILADLPNEAGAFALAGVHEHEHGADILVRRVIAVSPAQFRVRNQARLEIAPQAINGLIALCEKNRLGAVLCHSHPSDYPYSSSDDYGERRVFETLRQFVPANAPTASILLYPNGLRGRVWLPGVPRPVPISEVTVIGSCLRSLVEGHQAALGIDDYARTMFDRQVRAFGEEGQATIARVRVGVVGTGGTGSATAEQLIRLGVSDLILVDPDGLETSNRSRVYGTFASTMRNWGLLFRKRLPLKAAAVAAHLRRIAPEARVRVVPRSVVLTDAVAHLLDRDVIFLCTDDQWGRSVVNQIAYQYLIPTINLGMRITSDNGSITHAVGGVDVLRPDLPCLWCKQFLNAQRIAAESMPISARKSLEAEGYVEGIDTQAPSVISATTTISGLGVALFLQLLTGFMGANGDVARLNYDMLEGTVRRGTTAIAAQCICKKVRGFGDLASLPTLTALDFLDT